MHLEQSNLEMKWASSYKQDTGEGFRMFFSVFFCYNRPQGLFPLGICLALATLTGCDSAKMTAEEKEVVLAQARLWEERAQVKAQEGDEFGAALMAAAGLGFEGMGRAGASHKFQNRFPAKLHSEDPDLATVRQQLEAMVDRHIRNVPLWQSFLFDVGVETLDWSPDGNLLAVTSQGPEISLWDPDASQLIAVLKGHRERVTCARWSPDSTLLATGSRDDGVRLWKAESGEPFAELVRHADDIVALAWHPDGRQLASVSDDDQLCVWSIPEGEVIASHTIADGVESLTWHPDGSKIALGCYQGRVRVLDPISGGELAVLRNNGGEVVSLAWSPDGSRLACAGNSRVLSVWGLDQEQPLVRRELDGGAPQSIAWNSKGTCFAATTASGRDGYASIWDAETLQVLETLDDENDWGDSMRAVDWSPDGARIAVGGYSSLHIWELKSMPAPQEWKSAGEPVTSLDWHPKGKWVAAGFENGEVQFWDPIAGKQAITLEGNGGPVGQVEWSRDGSHLASTSADGSVRLWSLDTGESVGTLQAEAEGGVRVSWHPESKWLATVGPDHLVRIWDVATSEIESTLEVEDSTWVDLEWNPSGKSEIVLIDPTGKCGIWEIEAGKMKELHRDGSVVEVAEEGAKLESPRVTWSSGDGSIISGLSLEMRSYWANGTEGYLGDNFLSEPNQSAADQALEMVWNHDGSSLATGSSAGTLRVWAPHYLRASAEVGESPIRAIDWSPDGRRLVCGSDDGAIRVLSLEFSEVQQVLEAHVDGVTSVAWSPDGKWYASAGGTGDGKTILWEAATGRNVRQFKESFQSAEALAWNPDGTQLALAGLDSFYLWDMASGELMPSPEDIFEMHKFHLQWKPDGSSLAAWYDSIRFWNLDSGEVSDFIRGSGGVDWSPDEKQFATARYDTVYIFDGETFEEVRRMNLDDYVAALAWNAETGNLLLVLQEGKVEIRNPVSGEVLRESKLEASFVGGVFDPELEYFASVGEERDRLRVWDLSSGELLTAYPAHPDKTTCVAWSPDGKKLMAGFYDGQLRIFAAPGQRPKIDLAHMLEEGWLELEESSYQFRNLRKDVTVLGWDALTRNTP